MFPGVCLALWLRVRAGYRSANRRWRNPTPALCGVLGWPVAGISMRQVNSTFIVPKTHRRCRTRPLEKNGRLLWLYAFLFFSFFLVFSRLT